MWTDNAASYGYRTEPDLELPTTLEQSMNLLDDADVPVHNIKLDSSP